MRLNKYIAAATDLSRRAADAAIAAGRVTLNGGPVTAGAAAAPDDIVTLDGRVITPRVKTTTLMLNKPAGYVCSRAGQGSRTIYDLLPAQYRHLRPVGRLDKDSSGLLLLTDDGTLAHRLTHPRYAKTKVYQVTLDAPLTPHGVHAVTDTGVMLSDGLSRFLVEHTAGSTYRITMHEGRNRQIRRTFAALGYTVTRLHRTHVGPYWLPPELDAGCWSLVLLPTSAT